MVSTALSRLTRSVGVYFSVWWGKLIKLVMLNLLTIACCLTLVLIPSAIIAMNRVLLSILDHGDCEGLLKPFFQTVKAQFRSATLPGLLCVAIILAPLYSAWFYLQIAPPALGILLSAALISLVLVAWIWSAYYFVLCAREHAPTSTRAVLATIVRNPKHTAKLVVPLLLTVVCVSFFTYVFPVMLLIGFSSIQLAVCTSLQATR